MIIRDATEADLPAIVDIYNAAIPGRMATADTEPVTLRARKAWFHSHTPKRHPLWVAEIDGAIAGWLSFQPFSERAAYHQTAEIGLYVAPGSQRRGVGRRLLAEAIRRAPDLGLRTLIGKIFAHNEPSLRLFESLGFARWGFLPGVTVMDGVERDVVIVGLRVSEGRE